MSHLVTTTPPRAPESTTAVVTYSPQRRQQIQSYVESAHRPRLDTAWLAEIVGNSDRSGTAHELRNLIAYCADLKASSYGGDQNVQQRSRLDEISAFAEQKLAHGAERLATQADLEKPAENTAAHAARGVHPASSHVRVDVDAVVVRNTGHSAPSSSDRAARPTTTVRPPDMHTTKASAKGAQQVFQWRPGTPAPILMASDVPAALAKAVAEGRLPTAAEWEQATPSAVRSRGSHSNPEILTVQRLLDKGPGGLAEVAALQSVIGSWCGRRGAVNSERSSAMKTLLHCTAATAARLHSDHAEQATHARAAQRTKPPTEKELSDSEKVHDACLVGDLAALRKLIAAGAPIDLSDGSGALPIHYARANLELLRLLMAAGADVTARDAISGHNVLSLAAMDERPGSVEVVAFLTQPLVASHDERERSICFSTLLENRASDGSTAALVASSPAKLRLFRQAGADLRALTHPDGQTVFHRAVRDLPQQAAAAMLTALAELQAQDSASIPSVNARDSGGRTILHYLASTTGLGQTKKTAPFAAVLRQVVSRNDVDIDVADGRGFTPLMAALSRKHTEAVQILVERHAVLDRSPPTHRGGDTPLHVAATIFNQPVLSLLITKECNWCVQNARGETPLHVALKHNPQCARFLLEHAIQGSLARAPRTRDQDGVTPLQIARSKVEACAGRLARLKDDLRRITAALAEPQSQGNPTVSSDRARLARLEGLKRADELLQQAQGIEDELTLYGSFVEILQKLESASPSE